MENIHLVISPPNGESEQQWVSAVWQSEWGGDVMISRGSAYKLSDLKCLIVRAGEDLVGAASYRIDAEGCELMSINAMQCGRGIGTKLLNAVENAARLAGCQRIWLITSNDNLASMKFYQQRKYRMINVYSGAIDAARRLKPTIPLVGDHEIEIHDEIEFAKILEKPIDFG